ncbi:HlyD family efflux transporter periplasmic adaptor subunit [Victivallis sp. Marseille-Q1083]|uniref:HlyD family efflux transporter periplasmic adaptor subunit n=1 Tax=Victivallis sp. Marseille-Q1083 TaxID=2717288 RepID=UPI00158DBAE9|nr:HlyD family efflux transporter periplasmic adaptor subunit [Victivallis sp. Marseille-Q1083]
MDAQSLKPEPQQPHVGELRYDLELLPGEADGNGMPSYLIFDPVADTYFRLTESNYQIIRLLTGNPTLDAFLEKLKRAGVSASREEVLKLLSFLQQSNLMKVSYQLTERKVLQARAFKRKLLLQIALSSYLFFRIPLLRPDRFLNRTVGAVTKIFNHWTFLLLWTLVAIGYLGLIVNYDRFADMFVASISLQGFIRYSIAVTVIKVIHEFAHAYTAKSAGCRVRRMGIAFVFFLPRFYTDLTDSWRITDRRRRFLIDGAGIFSELVIGGLAALVWSFSRPGLTSTVSYYIFAVSIINTVFINGNPFIRYDGYYLLMDLLNLDNLQRRGTDLLKSFWRRHLFGLPLPVEPMPAKQRAGLFFYGISAFTYRIFLYTSIILIVYFNFTKTLGIVLLSLEVYLLILKPIYDEGKFLYMSRRQMRNRNVLLSLTGTLCIVLLLVLPLPWNVTAPCEVKAANSMMVYASISGFLETMPVEDGRLVKRGDLLYSLRNPFLEWRHREAELDEALSLTELDQAQRNADRLGEVDIIRQALDNNHTMLAELERKEAQLNTLSNLDGVFALHNQYLKPGQWINRGELLGEVFDPRERFIVAYLDENDIQSIRLDDRVTVVLNRELTRYPGRIVRIKPVPEEFAPSPLLSVFGGPVLSVPTEDGRFLPAQGCYEITVALDNAPALPIGRTGNVYLRKFSSVGGNILRDTVQVLRRELSF